MYYAYITKSKVDGSLYIGQTNDLRNRLRLHNEGRVRATEPKKPFELKYYEAYQTRELAQERENKLKYFGNAYVQLKRRIGL